MWHWWLAHQCGRPRPVCRRSPLKTMGTSFAQQGVPAFLCLGYLNEFHVAEGAHAVAGDNDKGQKRPTLFLLGDDTLDVIARLHVVAD